MARTTQANVIGILGECYPDSGGVSLQPYIDTASALVDKVDTCADDRGHSLSGTQLELIERWLAAHYYTIMDPIYLSKSSGGASGGFPQRSFLDAAMQLDTSGCLKGYINQNIMQAEWLGRPPSEQTAYADRD